MLEAASPEAAWRNGIDAAEQGDSFNALRWLERAQLLAPGDPRIALDLANIRLQAGGAAQLGKAAAAFEALTVRYQVAAAWIGLMAARRLLGEDEAAAQALQQLLSRHCVPEDQGFAEVASAVAAAAGRPGWCGIGADGQIACFLDGSPATPEQFALLISNAALLGSPLQPAALRRCEGLVETSGAELTGWVSRPAAPDNPPELFLQDAQGKRRRIGVGDRLAAAADAPLTPRYAFRCPAALLQDLTPPLRVLGGDGADLLGSPADPAAELAAVQIPASYSGPANRVLPERARLMVLVPVYRGLAVTQACLTAAFQALPETAGLIVVDDASPEPALAAWLDGFCKDERVRLIRHAKNRGFAAAANAGLRAAAGCDVLLLNSDALLPPRALQILMAALYSGAQIGSVTPLSNEATICSYPSRGGGNPAPDLAGAIALDALAGVANADQTVEIPTGVGFCLAMRHDCIARIGHFRPEIFAQGYGEEVDWCLRARHRGYRHVAATGAYAAHVGGLSFKAAGRALNLRNYRVLSRLYPGYEDLLEAHEAADPLAPARRRLDLARFKAGAGTGAVLLISHSHGGGVARRVAEEMREIRAAGQRPILLFPAMPAGPAAARYPYPAELTDGAAGDYPNLRFILPQDEPELLRLLHDEQVAHVVLHHALGHHPAMRRVAEKLGCPQDIVIHDYASFCPRVHLIGPENRYCGEPEVLACGACVAQAGDETQERLAVADLLARSATEFADARRVIAPSADAARRIARHFPKAAALVAPWEEDGGQSRLRPPRTGARRIALLGGIGIAKGYDILLECARDAAQRDLQLEFALAGSSFDDGRLLETGRIFITGPYRQAELPDLLASLDADLAFIPSIWPETWCFTLSEAWSAGLYTMAFDLGAQAERIRATARGALLPLGLPAPRVNDFLVKWKPG